MTRAKDPLYRKIAAGLEASLDSTLFEECAVDLLRNVYPGLVPTGGPHDGGMDGAISTPDGPPTLLVCTTSDRVLDNLTRSLKRYVNGGGKSRAVVVATSDVLTPQRRRNLEVRAQEHGFELKNVHDGKDFADRLYRSPRWRKELLGLPGDPPALSAYPRPCVPEAKSLLGRDAELSWLRAQEQDFVLVGPPGIGKTVLLQQLAEEGRGLFVATSDEGRIVDAWREARSDFLLLPDVHLRPELLSALLSLRLELDMDFQIAGTAWRSLRDESRVEWRPAPQEKAIGGLSRETTVHIVRSAGVENDDVAAEILDQSEVDPDRAAVDRSEHKPGLAVILALQVARSGAESGRPCADDPRRTRSSAQRRLRNGALVLRHVAASCELADRDVLGVAALGGRGGMTLANISKALQKSEADVRDVLRRVSSAGILSAGRHPDGLVSVVPEALRDALIASTFFEGATSLSAERTLEFVDDATSATAALISALGRGLPVPHDIVRNRLPGDPRDRSHRDLWNEYAWAGGKEASWWMLAEAEPLPPALAAVVARPSLQFLPRRAVALLLPRLPDDEVHEAVCDWMTELGADVMPRRQLILDKIAQLSRNNGDPAVLSLIPTVFSLELRSMHWSRLAPGRIDTEFDVLPLDKIKELFARWPTALEVLKRAKQGVAIARNVAQRWCSPQRAPAAGATDDWRQFVRECAAQMISDTVTLADKRPGIVLWARRTACEAQLDVPLPPMDSKVSEVGDLFPLPSRALATSETTANESGRPSARKTAERRKAEELAQADAHAGAEELLRLDEEGRLAGCSPEQQLQDLVEKVAQATERPAAWVEALAGRNAHPEWVSAFVDVALAQGEESQRAWNSLLESAKYADVVVWAGLRHGDVPERVEKRIVERLQVVGTLPGGIGWATVSEAWKLRLLRDGPENVATTVAMAMWWTGGLEGASRRLLSAWVDVAARSDDGSLLGEVFSSPSPIARRAACAWFLVPRPEPPTMGDDDPADVDSMLEHVEQALDFHMRLDRLPEKAASVLDRTTRARLIQDMPAETTDRAFLAVVGHDAELYGVLLARRDLSRVHLLPLRNGGALEAGPDFALRALDAGYSAREVADQIEPRRSPNNVFASASPEGVDRRIAGSREDSRTSFRQTMEAWQAHRSPDVRDIAGQALEREF